MVMVVRASSRLISNYIFCCFSEGLYNASLLSRQEEHHGRQDIMLNVFVPCL